MVGMSQGGNHIFISLRAWVSRRERFGFSALNAVERGQDDFLPWCNFDIGRRID
jgi:hypothetical protein